MSLPSSTNEMSVAEILDTAHSVIERYVTFDASGGRVVPEHVVLNLILALKGDKDALGAWSWRVSQLVS